MAAWAASQSAARAAAGPSFQDVPHARRRAAGLAHPRIETQVADQLAGAAEAVHVVDHGDHGGRTDEADAGDRHQAADLCRVHRVTGDGHLEALDLTVEEGDRA
jgi:hypothetical protein